VDGKEKVNGKNARGQKRGENTISSLFHFRFERVAAFAASRIGKEKRTPKIKKTGEKKGKFRH